VGQIRKRFTKKTNNMKNGVVKFFNEAKGFGFIKEEGGQDIFVHATGLQEDIRENDNVVFEVQEGKKGLNAVNVRLA
jgi:CspA family cold shock protein